MTRMMQIYEEVGSAESQLQSSVSFVCYASCCDDCRDCCVDGQQENTLVCFCVSVSMYGIPLHWVNQNNYFSRTRTGISCCPRESLSQWSMPMHGDPIGCQFSGCPVPTQPRPNCDSAICFETIRRQLFQD